MGILDIIGIVDAGAKIIGGIAGSKSAKKQGRQAQEYYDNLAQYNIDMSQYNAGYQRSLGNFYAQKAMRAGTDYAQMNMALYGDALGVIADKQAAMGIRSDLLWNQHGIRAMQSEQANAVRANYRENSLINSMSNLAATNEIMKFRRASELLSGSALRRFQSQARIADLTRATDINRFGREGEAGIASATRGASAEARIADITRATDIGIFGRAQQYGIGRGTRQSESQARIAELIMTTGIGEYSRASEAYNSQMLRSRQAKSKMSGFAVQANLVDKKRLRELRSIPRETRAAMGEALASAVGRGLGTDSISVAMTVNDAAARGNRKAALINEAARDQQASIQNQATQLAESVNAINAYESSKLELQNIIDDLNIGKLRRTEEKKLTIADKYERQQISLAGDLDKKTLERQSVAIGNELSIQDASQAARTDLAGALDQHTLDRQSVAIDMDVQIQNASQQAQNMIANRYDTFNADRQNRYALTDMAIANTYDRNNTYVQTSADGWNIANTLAADRSNLFLAQNDIWRQTNARGRALGMQYRDQYEQLYSAFAGSMYNADLALFEGQWNAKLNRMQGEQKYTSAKEQANSALWGSILGGARSYINIAQPFSSGGIFG